MASLSGAYRRGSAAVVTEIQSRVKIIFETNARWRKGTPCEMNVFEYYNEFFFYNNIDWKK